METEEEQVEKLKAWLKENGLSIVFGVVIGVGGIGGYNYWNQVQETAAAEASGHFSEMITALETGDRQAVLEHSGILINDYDSTDYALMAQLALARSHVEAAEFDEAAVALQQVVGSGAQKPLAYVARKRLAALQIQKGQIDEALSTLGVDFPEEFKAQTEELRGDAFALQGKVAQAIEAYRSAQTSSPGPANEAFLRQKLDDLGVLD